MASEALLDADFWNGISLDMVQHWLDQEVNSPYVQKNIVLILGQSCPDAALSFLRGLDRASLHPIVHAAIHYVLSRPSFENLLWTDEPRELRKYRAQSYPMIEELLSDKEYYAMADG